MPRGVYPHKKGSANKLYKGDACALATAYWRAAQLYPGPHRCQWPRCGRRAQRHHVDGNPRNNAPDNLAFYCVKHHALAEDRGRHLRGKKRNFSAKQRGEFARRMAAQNRARKGKPHSKRHNAAVSAAITAWWARRKGRERHDGKFE